MAVWTQEYSRDERLARLVRCARVAISGAALSDDLRTAETALDEAWRVLRTPPARRVGDDGAFEAAVYAGD